MPDRFRNLAVEFRGDEIRLCDFEILSGDNDIVFQIAFIDLEHEIAFFEHGSFVGADHIKCSRHQRGNCRRLTALDNSLNCDFFTEVPTDRFYGADPDLLFRVLLFCLFIAGDQQQYRKNRQCDKQIRLHKIPPRIKWFCQDNNILFPFVKIRKTFFLKILSVCTFRMWNFSNFLFSIWFH